MRRWSLFLGVSFASAIAACVIGPKQDDPLVPPPIETDTEAGTSGDGGFGGDEGLPTPNTEIDASAEAPPNQVTDAAADATADATGEACPDGGAPLTAYGPWHDGKSCWKARVVFECVAAIDGGAAFTCFARVSTSELFLAETTQLPSGSDFRACTEAERARVKSMPALCAK